jgi:hypothetical protein
MKKKLRTPLACHAFDSRIRRSGPAASAEVFGLWQLARRRG